MVSLCWTELKAVLPSLKPLCLLCFCCVNRIASFSQKSSLLIKGGCVLCNSVYMRAQYPTGVLHRAPRAIQREEDPSEASARESPHKLHLDTCALTALFFLCTCTCVCVKQSFPVNILLSIAQQCVCVWSKDFDGLPSDKLFFHITQNKKNCF